MQWKEKKNLHSQVKILSKKVAIIFFLINLNETSWYQGTDKLVLLFYAGYLSMNHISKFNYEVIQM